MKHVLFAAILFFTLAKAIPAEAAWVGFVSPPPTAKGAENISAMSTDADCELQLVGSISEADIEIINKFMSNVAMSGNSIADQNWSSLQNSIIYMFLSAAYRLPFKDLSKMPMELKRSTDFQTDLQLAQKLQIPVPVQLSYSDWEKYTLNIIDKMESTWTAIDSAAQPITWKTRMQSVWARRISTEDTMILGRIRQSRIENLLKPSFSSRLEEIQKLKKLVASNRLIRLYVVQRMPRLLVMRQDNFDKYMQYLNQNGLAAFKDYSLHLPMLRKDEIMRVKLRISQLQISTQVVPSQTQDAKQDFSIEKARHDLNIMLSALLNWNQIYLSPLDPQSLSLSAAQYALNPLREGSRLISDALLAAPVPPEAKNLEAFWAEHKDSAANILVARKQIRQWHDLAREQLVQLEALTVQIREANDTLSEQLNQFVESVKKASEEKTVAPETAAALSGLVNEANLIKMTAEQIQLAAQSRIQRQLNWIEALVYVETISAQPIDEEKAALALPHKRRLALPALEPETNFSLPKDKPF